MQGCRGDVADETPVGWERFRHLVVFLIIAVFVAAVLRHVLHVYGSISREEIRTGSLLALFLSASLYLSLLAIKRRR
jgi:hypothetical protein